MRVQDPPQAYLCKFCGSSRLRKLSLIYLEGTSRSQNLGIVFYRGLSRRAIFGSRGKRQTLLASRAAPPSKKNVVLRGAFWIAGTLFAAVLGWSTIGVTGVSLLFIGAVLAGVMHIRAGLLFNSTDWRSLYDVWNRSYLCGRCGKLTCF